MTRAPTVVTLALLGAFGAGWLLAGYGPWHRAPERTAAPAAERRVLYWVAPMDPGFRSDKPGKSPMNMDLVPVYEGEEPDGPGISIDPQVVNNIGVRSAMATNGSLRAPIETVGRILFDEALLAHVHLRSSGWIQRLAVRSEGEPVVRGDLLFEVYSPDLVKVQAEFLQALRGGRTELIDATRERLRALDISGPQIAAMERTRKALQYVGFYAPISGIVASLNVADGKYVTPANDIMVIANLSKVWLISDVFEAQADQVETGARVTARSKFDAGRVINATVDYIYPDLDPVTRTVPVRSVIENPAGALKPGMFMTVRIDGRQRPPATLIPTSALIRTGRAERVILALGEGRFQPAEVTSGAEADGMVEILDGLSPGEHVVISGQFLIDSESSFQGAALRMAGSEAAESGNQMDHSDMDHGDSGDEPSRTEGSTPDVTNSDAAGMSR